MWNAYWADVETMDGALLLGSIHMQAVENDVGRRQAFMDMMKDIVSGIIENEFEISPEWGGAGPAPAHEKSGHS